MSTLQRKNTKRRRPQAKRGNNESGNQRPSRQARESSALQPREADWLKLGVAGVVVLATFAWAYWPTLVELVSAWEREPDYSHGYFVVPLALFFLYARRETFPGWQWQLAWPGLVLIAMSVGIRIFGARYYVGPIDGWSILFWVAGVVWFLGGWRVLWWSAPSIAFLWFMIPLPWRVERWLSLPLQRIATTISCWALQCFGQPALAEGNVILINDYKLEVEQACSGLRIFVGIVALAFAYIVLVRRSWWERAFLLLSVLPVALVANATRIVATGLLNQYVSGEAAHKFTHDISGYVMIPFAAGLFALVLWYLGKLMREVEVIDIGEIARREAV
jgi:exosortase